MNEDFFLKALVKENKKAILTIYKNNLPKVKSFVLKNNGNIEDAEDIFQRALLQIAIRYKKEQFCITTSFDAYLFTVCKNLWRRELNKHKNKVTNSEVVELANEERENSLALVEQKRQELFMEKMKEISENCRQILFMFFAKTSYAEIVSATKYNSETVVRQRVFKCKKKLTEIIKADKRYNSLREI
ncbi:sigma-70 family RNA polymerase sigma factor [Tenacibaculum aiptasiae]|uniref:Sigma-70 family RNA polymerase sigma factor n=1 Tax=Tenacibaculum aiptasiae TaxID=426481 RepID=A0A7J5AAD3_9FLAO|nr:sigma-70 family RNA polymerase sigma factor [Tenacibaculum aiptasiae]KAB1154500.1 sigma-70 family RNA polymerase sigma factor [Tenacibaculum aiptasiae]